MLPGQVLGRPHQKKEAVVAPVGEVISDSRSLGVAEHCPKKIVHITLQISSFYQRLPVAIRNSPNHKEASGTQPHHVHVALSCKHKSVFSPLLSSIVKHSPSGPQSLKGGTKKMNMLCSDRESPGLYAHPWLWGFYLPLKVMCSCSPAFVVATVG